MPTYEYECRACGYTFERSQNMSELPVKECPECGKDVRRIIFGGSGVIFKGSGFYVNDARSKNAAAPSSDSKPSEGKETKPAAATSMGSPTKSAATKESA
ncbi:MAG: zinc ribbon domain-containing protein [Spirochaetales bacterium]|nr:MAG: zinc ribbon domain-containing protein [Spirochaetales bacterium]